MKWLLRLGISRGLLGGNRFFATLGGLAAVVRVLEKLSGGGEKSVYKSKLEKGQVVVISDGKKSP